MRNAGKEKDNDNDSVTSEEFNAFLDQMSGDRSKDFEDEDAVDFAGGVGDDDGDDNDESDNDGGDSDNDDNDEEEEGSEPEGLDGEDDNDDFKVKFVHSSYVHCGIFSFSMYFLLPKRRRKTQWIF